MRLSVNIEKRYAYFIIGAMLILIASIVVYAQTSGGSVSHSANQVTEGTFSGSLYSFQDSISVAKTLDLGKTGAGTQQGVIKLQPGPGIPSNVLHIDNALGEFRISDASWNELFRIRSSGEVRVKQGQNLCLGNDCRSSWSGSLQCVIKTASFATSGTSSVSINCDPGYTLTGGGAKFDSGDSSPDLHSYPDTTTPNKWNCFQQQSRGGACYAICCKL